MNNPITALAAAPQSLNIVAIRAASSAPKDAATEFMYMAGGLHDIHCSHGEKKIDLSVMVDSNSAGELEKQRKLLASNSKHKPFFDFDHENGRASFHPSEFFWNHAPAGVFVRGTWTSAGKNAIEGHDYGGFSPQFHVDNPRATKTKPARVICYAQASLNMGGLVNDPAFKSNLPLWAKHAGHSSAVEPKANYIMTDIEKAALEAKIQQTKNDLAELQQQDQTEAAVAESVAAKNNDLALAEAQVATKNAEDRAAAAEREIMVTRTEKSQAIVAAAVKRGALPTKDTALHAAWAKRIVEDPSVADLLAKIPGSPALTPPIATRDNGSSSHYIRAISRESDADVLNGMARICAKQSRQNNLSYLERIGVAKEVCSIYAKEIIPRLREGDDIPLLGVNTLGTLAQTLVATRTLELLTKELPILSTITTDFSDQIVSYGDALKTRIVGIPAVIAYNTAGGWPTPSPVTTTDVTLTYNKWMGCPIQFLAHETAGTVRRLFDELAPAAAWALGDDMVTYVLALITAANFTNTVTAAGVGTFARSSVIDMGTALRKRGVPAGASQRTLILNSDYFGALGKDSAIVALAAYQKADIITGGVLPDVHGFKVLDCPTLPATAIGAGTLAGFGFSKSALILATRLTSDYISAIPGAGNGNLTVVTTPSGFSANLVQFVDHVVATTTSRLDVIYAASAGQDNAGQILQAP